jgi:transcriptional regulator with XRE-family HTH domain
MKPHQKLLHEYLEGQKKINPRFSLRSFARLMSMSPSQLSSLMSGKKELTKKLASKIIEHLSLDTDTSMKILKGLVPNSNLASIDLPELKVLTSSEIAAISEWYYYAILGLANLEYNRANPEWVAEKLSLDVRICQEALSKLTEMGIIKVEEDGRFIQIVRNLTSSTDVPSAVIRNAHIQNLQLAINKIEKTPVNLREYSSITMSVDVNRIPQVKKMINEFKQNVCVEFNKGPATEVYTLSIQLFPLTNVGAPL